MDMMGDRQILLSLVEEEGGGERQVMRQSETPAEEKQSLQVKDYKVGGGQLGYGWMWIWIWIWILDGSGGLYGFGGGWFVEWVQ